jgi:hypothetical protein
MRQVLGGLVAVPLAALLVAGCGSNTRAPDQAPVHLSLSSPADGARLTAQTVMISGTVSPAGATVLVAGRGVPVSAGSFQTRVTLSPGQNIVDVLAGAPHARAAMAAVRVFRQVNVPVPSVIGDTVAAAKAALRSRGLTARTVENEPFYSFILPGSPVVCTTSPPAGRPVAPGSTVTVNVSKSC